MLGFILYGLMQRIRIDYLEQNDNHDNGILSFFYYQPSSFDIVFLHVLTSMLLSPLGLILFGIKFALVSVFLPFVWLFLGFTTNTIGYLLIITEYLFLIFVLFHFAKLVITLILLCKAEALRIIQLIKTQRLYSVTFFIDFKYYTISIRRALRSLDRVNYVRSRLQLLDCVGFVVVVCVGGFSTIQIILYALLCYHSVRNVFQIVSS